MTTPAKLDQIKALQAEMVKLPQFEPPTKHIFHGGMYLRQVWRPKDCLIVGKVHLKEHFYMVVHGTVAVTTDEGVETITGPHLLLCKPGTKRAVYAVTDALCMTIHATDATTVADVEDEIVEPDPTSPFTVGNVLKDEVLT